MDARPFPDWLEFHTLRFGGPVAAMRSRSGVVRLETGEGETADDVKVGIPDDHAWTRFTGTLEDAGFWEWPLRTEHREPHKPGDWYWWLEVREASKRDQASGWNEAPQTFDRVRDALFELVEQVVR
jgi:hypothetical protein